MGSAAAAAAVLAQRQRSAAVALARQPSSGCNGSGSAMATATRRPRQRGYGSGSATAANYSNRNRPRESHVAHPPVAVHMSVQAALVGRNKGLSMQYFIYFFLSIIIPSPTATFFGYAYHTTINQKLGRTLAPS